MTDLRECTRNHRFFVSVRGCASDADDENVAGLYGADVRLSRQVHLNNLDEDDLSAIAAAILNAFHEDVAISVLDDFLIEVLDVDGYCVVEGVHDANLGDLVDQVDMLGSLSATEAPLLVSLVHDLSDGEDESAEALISSHLALLKPMLQDEGTRLLSIAAMSDAGRTCQALLDLGLDPDVRDEDGQTALHAAAMTGSTQAIAVLVQAQANVNASDESGATPISLAQANGHEQAAALLLASAARTSIEGVRLGAATSKSTGSRA